MKNEIKVLFTAIMFYTRIPVPKSTGFSNDNLNKSSKYFPLVGIIVGGVGAVSFIGSNYLLSTQTSVLLSILSMIMLTGAFHEDAIADFCDGFGGGYTKKRILEIMKDSQIGTYGAVSLIVLIVLKVLLLSEINPKQIPFVIIAAHALSRVNPIILMYTSKYIRDDDSSKSKPVGEKKSVGVLIIAILLGIVPMFFLPYVVAPLIAITLILIMLYHRYYIHKKIGGYTGDILGALQQFSEIGFYIAFIISSKMWV
jgi:adenosylcobinamide-GDP ribazoletransferase